MNSQVYDGKFIKYHPILLKLKLWALEEILPLLWFTTFFLILSSPLSQPIFMVYTCWKWRVSIVFWLAYLLWTLYDSKTLNAGSRKIKGFQYSRTLNSLRGYFPLRLIKLADLPPDKNYILGCFPHGVVPFGCGANLCTNTNRVAELFPNIDIRIVTVPCIFRFPVAREFFMALGFCSANKENILQLLKGKPSKALAIFPGGNKEVSLSRPGHVYTIVKNRKGYIKVALETGSSLVPVFSFGENNTFDQERFQTPIIVGLNKFLYKYTRAELVNVRGRGYFPSHFGILPHRRPITTVVGKPIEVPKVENPPAELVDEYHEKFFKALLDMFEKYKHEYDETGEAAQLIMV